MTRRQFYLFVGPSAIMMLLLMVVPLLGAVWLGFHFISFRNVTNPQWVGLENYVFMLSDSGFWNALVFTLQYIAVTVPLQMLLGLVVALLLDQVRHFRAFYIAATLLPFIVTPIVGTLIYRQSFDRYGIYPYLLDRVFGIEFSFFAVSNIQLLIFSHAIWYVTPFAVVTLFAGLQTLPEEPLEAALVDGANWWQRLRYIVLPHLNSFFIFIALISIMDAYRVFDSIFVLTKQNPIYTNVQTLMYYNYKVAVEFQNLGRANAMSVLTVIGIFVILIPFLYVTYKQQTEER
ncbi:MAG: sugar ABC transporter permease [Anaerolineae bacterium]|nr:sugar ABC transporter permease [Anaerolineae bacterium]MDW8173725.1 sugar ABC transporter permease [Anaerolineae bacterium]